MTQLTNVLGVAITDSAIEKWGETKNDRRSNTG